MDNRLCKLQNYNQIALFFAVIFFVYACSDIPSDKSALKDTAPPTTKNIHKPGSSFNDTMVIDKKAVIFYLPDSLQLKKIKAVNDKSIFESLEHDCHFQMGNARNVINAYWKQLVVVENNQARYLLFIKKNNTRSLVDLNDKNDICGIFLFDGENEPEQADMMNIDTALGFYFKK